MAYEELIHTEEREGFEVRFYACEEDTPPSDHFDVNEYKDLLEGIREGKSAWFMAKVTASKGGIELGEDYLGGCCHTTEEDFIEESGYYLQMVDTAIEEAKATLKELCK